MSDRNELFCNICFENYNSSNKKPMIMMQCCHTICLNCLNDLGLKECPFCIKNMFILNDKQTIITQDINENICIWNVLKACKTE